MIHIALVDDHTITRKGIKTIIESGGNITVSMEASNGMEFLSQLSLEKDLPDILIIDLSMPVMNGFDTITQVQQQFPSIRIIVFSLLSDKDTILNMINNGASGYLHKSADPLQLIDAIITVYRNEYYLNDLVKREYFSRKENVNDKVVFHGTTALSNREIQFIKLCGKEMTYREMAEEMKVSPKTIENYRENLFKKLSIKNRVGLIVYGYRNGLLHILPAE